MLCRLFSGSGERGDALVVELRPSLQWLLLLQSVGSGAQQSVHGLRCSAVCGVFPGQGLNPCLRHWQVGSLPLSTMEPQTLLCCRLLSLTCHWVHYTEHAAHQCDWQFAPFHSFHAGLSPLLTTCWFSVSTTLFLFYVCSFGFFCFCFSRFHMCDILHYWFFSDWFNFG